MTVTRDSHARRVSAGAVGSRATLSLDLSVQPQISLSIALTLSVSRTRPTRHYYCLFLPARSLGFLNLCPFAVQGGKGGDKSTKNSLRIQKPSSSGSKNKRQTALANQSLYKQVCDIFCLKFAQVCAACAHISTRMYIHSANILSGRSVGRPTHRQVGREEGRPTYP